MILAVLLLLLLRFTNVLSRRRSDIAKYCSGCNEEVGLIAAAAAKAGSKAGSKAAAAKAGSAPAALSALGSKNIDKNRTTGRLGNNTEYTDLLWKNTRLLANLYKCRPGN
jgi:hypothetical protein